MIGEEICVEGNRYRVVNSVTPIGSNGTGTGGYYSAKFTISAREKLYEISFGLKATQLNIRADYGFTMKLNSVQNDDIFIEVSELPFSISELKDNESIHTLFITTGDNDTEVRIFAIGQR